MLAKEHQSLKNKMFMYYYVVHQLKDRHARPLNGETVSRNALVLEKRAGVYQYHRENTKRFEVLPGTYVVIPSTFHHDQEAQFMLRFITERPVESG